MPPPAIFSSGPSPKATSAMSDSADTIEIRRLRVETHIGVPDTERATAQPLWITLRLVPAQGFNGLRDSIANTIDYQQVAGQVSALAAASPRHLIETLAVEIADLLLSSHPLSQVRVRVEKKILPDTDCVAVELERRR